MWLSPGDRAGMETSDPGQWTGFCSAPRTSVISPKAPVMIIITPRDMKISRAKMMF